MSGVVQFVYLKESFSPSLDEKISTLFEVAKVRPPVCPAVAKRLQQQAEPYKGC